MQKSARLTDKSVWLPLAGGAVVVAGAASLSSAPLALVAVPCAVALGAVGAAFWPSGGGRVGDVPFLITDFFGAQSRSGGDFEREIAPLYTALLGDPAASLSLYRLRQDALARGSASGMAGDLHVRVQRDGERLIHTFERTRRAPSSVSAVADALVAAVPAPLMVLDHQAAVVAANPSARTVLGDAADILGALDLDADALDRLVRQARTRGQSGFEASLRADPDRKIRLSAKAFPEQPGGMPAPAAVIALTDVTERSALEAQMVQNQKMHAIGELAGNIAHDFNNVLTGIIGFSDLLLQSHRPSDPAFSDIMQIKQNAQRAARLVRQLLAFSRRQTLRPSVIDLNDAIADMALMLDRVLGERVPLTLSYGRDLWPVLADLSQVEQVIINLAVNARDAMPNGGSVTVRTRNAKLEEGADEALEGDAVLIEVADEGVGMPQDMLDKIFEPFFTTKAMGKGTGLGLSTVYGIVKQTGGTLTVDSAPGEGTTFRIYLPRARVEAAVQDRAPADAPAALDEAAPSLVPDAEPVTEVAPVDRDLTGSATILFAEDEEAVREFAARALSAKGYRVLAGANGAEALELFASHGDSVDLLLTDVIMPELDGPTLVRRARATRPDLKVVFMSGYADVDALDGIQNVQFLPKPFTLKALAEAVKRELSH